MNRCSDPNCEDGRIAFESTIISIFSDYPKGSVCKKCGRVHNVGVNTPIIIKHPMNPSKKVLLYVKKNGKFIFKFPKKYKIVSERKNGQKEKGQTSNNSGRVNEKGNITTAYRKGV